MTGIGAVSDATASFPNGRHMAEVELDPETGLMTLTRYTLVDDFGVIINPLLAGGQAQGGVAQGVGRALTEQAVHDPETGQPLAASFMHYAIPRAADFPALAGIPAAARDALARAGGALMEAPFTPARAWAALRR